MGEPRRVVLVAVLLVVGVAVLLIWPRDDPTNGPAPSRQEELAESPDARVKSYLNERGHYSFSYPVDWEVRAQGARTNLTGPGDAATISIGPLAAGTLDSASRDLLAAIQDGYARVRVSRREESSVGELQARAVAGSAVNARGAKLRFLVVAIEAPEAFFGITMFAPEASNPATVLPPAQAIISSFRVVDGS